MLPAVTSAVMLVWGVVHEFLHVLHRRERLGEGEGFGERADGVEATADFGGAGDSAEVVEQVPVQGHGDEAVRRRYVVVRKGACQLALEVEQVVDVPEEQFLR